MENKSYHTADTIIALTGNLITILEEETELLRNFDTEALTELQDIKAKLCAEYATTVEFLKTDQKYLDSLTDGDRARLTQSTQELCNALEMNERVVKAIDEANRTVMEIFTDVVGSNSPTTYNQNGLKNDKRQGPSAIDQRS